MKKRSILLTVLALILVAGISIGGTMAYFQQQSDPVVNTFTVGNIDISLDEPNWDESEASNLVPSVVVDKDPTVSNIGSNPCYVRLKVTGLTCGDDELNSEEGLYAVGENIGPTSTWYYNPLDGYYYYTEILDAKDGETIDKTTPLFTGIGLSEDAVEGSSDSELEITIVAEAIQCEGILAPADSETIRNAAIRAFASFDAPAAA